MSKSIVTKTLGLCFVFFLVCLPSALADTVYLTSGESIKGLVVEEHHDRIVFSTYQGEIQVPRIGIDQIFFDNEEQNYAYMGDMAFAEGDFTVAIGFYQKAYQMSPDFKKVKGAFSRLADAINRSRLNMRLEEAEIYLKKQLGLVIKRSGNKIKILEVAGNSAAKKAGVLPGYFLDFVWDASSMFMDARQAAYMLVGAPNTPVKITVEKNIFVPMNPLSWIERFFYFGLFIRKDFDVILTADGLIVRYVIPTSRAAKNGLQAGDVIIYINGEPTRYMPLSIARRKIFKASLDSVVLTTRHETFIVRR